VVAGDDGRPEPVIFHRRIHGNQLDVVRGRGGTASSTSAVRWTCARGRRGLAVDRVRSRRPQRRVPEVPCISATVEQLDDDSLRPPVNRAHRIRLNKAIVDIRLRPGPVQFEYSPLCQMLLPLLSHFEYLPFFRVAYSWPLCTNTKDGVGYT